MSPPPTPAEPRVTFYGAAQTVTGSMHYMEVGRRRFLLDCGLFQGKRSEARVRNCCFPFDPHRVEAVILSHAHLDHCGNLPNLVNQGFSGPIYCTPATRDLLALMLADAAKIQEEDAAYLNRHRERGAPLVEPLYTRKQAHDAVKLAHAVPYDRRYNLGQGLDFQFVDAGHLLGSAMVSLVGDTTQGEWAITFTGDLGRRGLPILRDPAPVPTCDLLISESTYGGRYHPPAEDLQEQLCDVVRRTFARGGKLLIPAFALGRTQTVVFFLHQLIRQGRLPELPVYVDSPLATAATEVFRLHPDCYDEKTADLLEDHPDLFGHRRIHYTESVEESKNLNNLAGPAIIIAASGMCESGRILHHLIHHIEDPRTTILIIGFQAPETLGRRLVERRPEVRILNRTLQLQAEVVVMNGFSSHADHKDFLDFFGPLAGQPQHVRLVHGEPPEAEALAQALRTLGFDDVEVPKHGDFVTVSGRS